MEITTIKMSMKLSKETPAGWRGLELGAEATLSPRDPFSDATEQLYSQLRAEFTKLWNHNGITETHQEQPEANVTITTKNEEPKREPRTITHGDYADPATDAQIRMIFGKAKAAGLPPKVLRDMVLNDYGVAIDNLNKKQASEIIKSLASGQSK